MIPDRITVVFKDTSSTIEYHLCIFPVPFEVGYGRYREFSLGRERRFYARISGKCRNSPGCHSLKTARVRFVLNLIFYAQNIYFDALSASLHNRPKMAKKVDLEPQNGKKRQKILNPLPMPPDGFCWRVFCVIVRKNKTFCISSLIFVEE